MTQDEIIDLAKEAGYSPYQFTELSTLEAFANLVAAKERRECAKLAAEVGYWGLVNEIEARGEQA